jgi:hypothetical protein
MNNNKMVNKMIIDTLNNVVGTITNGDRTKSPKLMKKVGLALSVLTSDKGSLSYYDLNS